MRIIKICLCLFFIIQLEGLGQDHKNILFIIVDDLKPTLHFFADEQAISPNIDALANESTVFTSAYTQQAVCAPSRVSFLTGMRPDYTKVWDLKTLMRDMNPDILTMPQYFKSQGYQTFGLGKVFHGAKNNDPPSWSTKFIDNDELPYDEGYGQPANFKYHNERSMLVYNDLRKEIKGDLKADNVWLRINRALKAQNAHPSTEALDIPDDAYVDGAVTKRSLDLLKSFAQNDDPFMLVVGFNRPHLPFTAPKKYWDLYDRNDFELSAFQEKAKGSPSFAYHNSGELRNYSDIGPAFENGLLSEDKQRELIHGYYASVSYVDTQIGQLMHYLKESGLAENTVVVLVGDHGWHLGDHGLWNKHSNFEQATRTPMMIKDPSNTQGVVNDSPVELIDVFPTLCELTSLNTPKHLQGTSLVSIMTGEKSMVKEVALSQYPRGDRMGYSVRNSDYRLVEWHEGKDAENGIYNEDQIVAIEFYDYTLDALETKNLAKEPQYQEEVAKLRKSLKQIINQSNLDE